MSASAGPRPAGARSGLPRSAILFMLADGFAFAVVAAALVTQHGFAMEPCPWCVLQRLIFLVAGIVASAGIVVRSRGARTSVAALGIALALAGFASALWQQFVAAKSASCNLTLADRIIGATQLDRLLPDVFEARASCADAAVNLLGVPYAIWSALAFAIFALLLLAAARSPD
ncbi:MAG: disulfide bond formation protein B [Caldimonas sp.]